MKTIFPVSFVTFIVIFLSASAQTRKNKQALDGKTFIIQLTKTNGKRSGWQWTTDEISFMSYKFRLKEMRIHEGFRDAACSIAIDSSASQKLVTFEATEENNGISEIKWKGIVKGETIEGTAIWKNGQGTQSYEFSGTLK